MLVRHKNTTFNGTVVLATLPFRFVAGVAEVPDLSASRLAATAIKGWSVVEPEVTEEPAVEPQPTKRKPKSKKEFELNEDVAPEDMEQPEPEIG